MNYLIAAVVSIIPPIVVGTYVYGGEIAERVAEWRDSRRWKRERCDVLAATEGTVWLEHEGTTYITENAGSFGFSIVVKDRVGGRRLWEMGQPLRGFPIVDRLDELVDEGRAYLIASNCGYPLVYACRARDLPSAGLDGDEWLRVEACDAS